MYINRCTIIKCSLMRVTKFLLDLNHCTAWESTAMTVLVAQAHASQDQEHPANTTQAMCLNYKYIVPLMLIYHAKFYINVHVQ